MKFLFVCPETHRPFESEHFGMIENRGVIKDESGNKTLDAKVGLSEDCPFCGKRHVFHVSELTCPFLDRKPASKQ